MKVVSFSLLSPPPVFLSHAVSHINNSRRSHWRCSVKKGVLRNFAKITGKHLRQSLFFNKLLLKRDSGTDVFL